VFVSPIACVDHEKRVPAGHPLRAMRELVNAALLAMDKQFAAANQPLAHASAFDRSEPGRDGGRTKNNLIINIMFYAYHNSWSCPTGARPWSLVALR
jgi:hypothetical protein